MDPSRVRGLVCGAGGAMGLAEPGGPRFQSEENVASPFSRCQIRWDLTPQRWFKCSRLIIGGEVEPEDGVSSRVSKVRGFGFIWFIVVLCVGQVQLVIYLFG